MRFCLLTLIIGLSLGITAQSHTEVIEFQGHSFYYVSKGNNYKLLVFLHGGVNNPRFKNATKITDLEFLLEGNKDFPRVASENGFDLLIPVKDDSLNWLDDPDYSYQVIRHLLKSREGYEYFYIGGFSDGGTGSYKMFYSNKEPFDGLIVFNGYPQHKNFNQSVDYSECTDSKILFISTYHDQQIPYEFLLTEYAAQKEYNPDTYMYIRDGKHSFEAYDTNDFTLVFEMLNTNPDNTETTPIHGYVRRDQLIQFYTFRKMVVRKFSYGKEFLKINRDQAARYD